MKKPVIVPSLLILIVVAVVAFVGLTYLRMPAKSDSGDQSLVIAACVQWVKSMNPSATSQPTVSQIAIVSNYALTTWVWGNGGGQAVFEKQNNAWAGLGK
ncbi:MAG: hypothetical protein M3Z37_04615, partial [Candidatus Eremiobacteraeota bacterium]|nr:hypothetical protein [Candidatus Eremiobacteraeota bacterium]